MVAVFEDCSSAVTRVKFSRHQPQLFAFATADGTFRVCHVGHCAGPRNLLLPKAGPRKGGSAGHKGSPRLTATQGTKRSSGTASPLKGSPVKKGHGAGAHNSGAQGRTSGTGSPVLSKDSNRSSSSSSNRSSSSPTLSAGPGQLPQHQQGLPGLEVGSAASLPRAQKEIPRVMHSLQGHTKEVTDFDWSSDDEYLCSASLDRSLRVWEVSSGRCLRIIYSEIHQLCIRFHPMNSNFLVAANAKPELTVLNFSTGRVVSRNALGSRVAALEADRSNIFFAGDAEGCIHSLSVDPRSGAIVHHHSNRTGVQHPAPTASLHFHPSSALARTPVLLSCTQDGSVSFYSVALELQGYLFLKCSLHKSSRGPNLCAAFSPCLASAAAVKAGAGEFIVTGNADHQVCFFDFSQPRHLFAGRALGHKGFVMDVSFSLTGEWLASGDATGVVILWTPIPASELS